MPESAVTNDTETTLGTDLLALVDDLATELRAGSRANLDSRLEDDLGIDSLARMELLLRVQRRFGVTLSDEAALGAATPREILRALTAARMSRPLVVVARTEAPSLTVVAGPSPDLPTLVDALIWHAREHGERVHLELTQPDETTIALTYGELLEEARQLAAGLQARQIQRGQSVALMLPTSRSFFVAFLGIQLAGAVPVPIYPPFRASQLEDHLRRQALILENAQAVWLIGSSETSGAAHWLRRRLVGLRGVATVAELSVEAREVPLSPRPSDVALLQYTSGSTGDPKGVVLTHANLLANVRAMGEAAEIKSSDVVVSWLPLYHDMGLIGTWLGSLYHGCRLVVMPPTRFLAQPASWLRAIHRHQGTLAAAPNFAYEICASRLADDALAGLDLRSWRLAFNGSEPVSPGTVARFAARFAHLGFPPTAMTPVYGLAESSVALCFTPAGRGPRLDRLDRRTFEEHGRATPAADDQDDPLVFVSSGRPIARHQVRIVDTLGREAPDRLLGRIQFRGPSATSGYFQNQRATATLFDGDWLETGDLGYVGEGELFVTGRSKDVIIRAGRHIFPYEIEEAVGGIAGVRRGGVAVFSVSDEKAGTEKVVVVAETRQGESAGRDALRAAVGGATALLLGTPPEEVVLVPPRTIPKTSSGKTRRGACRELYLRGALGRDKSGRRQKMNLTLRLWRPLVRRALRATGAVAYAAWFWIWLSLLILPGLLAALVIPGDRLRWRVVSAIIRGFFVGAGIPIRLTGREHLSHAPCVLVLNHASYVDSLALVALLPPGFSLVAKRELEDNPFLRRALRRLGVVFVERFDLRRSVQEVAHLEQALRQGRSLVVFPEGTNRRIPGLFPFHQGAFLVAGRTGAPVVPGGIVGSRTVLRADQWFPRPGRITVVLRPAFAVASDAWQVVSDARDRARREIADATGEPLVVDPR